MTALTMIREEIADTYLHGIPTASEVRQLKAKLWPVAAGWDYVTEDVHDGARFPVGFRCESEIERLIALAIAETDDDGADPEKKLGALLVRLAKDRANEAYSDILEELEPGDPEYGMDLPETARVSLDRSARE